MPQVNEACSRRKICVTITKLRPCTGEKKPKNHEKWPSRPFFKKTVSTIFCFAFFLETRPISELNDTTFIRVLGRNSFCRYLTHVSENNCEVRWSFAVRWLQNLPRQRETLDSNPGESPTFFSTRQKKVQKS